MAADRHYQSLQYAMQVLKSEEYRGYIREVYLYGSCARGTQSYHSDVDLMVMVTEDVPHRILVKLRSEIVPEDYSLPEVEVKFSKTERFDSCGQFRDNIEREGVLLWKNQ